ncbi:post-transcriptional regulator [Shouchella lonarensis]|nr:post-transcriptional regulator [Shouchella lonarensis]
MGEKQQFDVWQEEIMPALHCKLEEFHDLGYRHVQLQDLWECLITSERKKKSYVPFYAFVDACLSMRPQDYMTWVTMKSYQEPADWQQAWAEVTGQQAEARAGSLAEEAYK